MLLTTTDDGQRARATNVDAVRRDAIAAVSSLTESLTGTVNAGVQEVFENQKQVEDAARELSETSVAFKDRARAWANALEEFDDELKNIGDFENWVKAMEHDLSTLAAALEEKVTASAAKAKAKN